MADMNHQDCKEVFEEACRSGDTSKLYQFIIEKKFDVNLDIDWDLPSPQTPLIAALNRRSMPVVTLLIDQGARIDCDAYNPALLKAIRSSAPKPVGTLMMDPVTDHVTTVWAIRRALAEAISTVGKVSGKDLDTFNSNMDYLKTKLLRMSQSAQKLLHIETPHEPTSDISKYARLSLAIIMHDKDRVNELLRKGDYYDYAKVIPEECGCPRLVDVALRLGGPEIVKIFIDAGADTTILYFDAIRQRNIEIFNFCIANPEFDPHIRDSEGRTALHIACWSSNFEIINILVNGCGLDLEERDSSGRKPISYISEVGTMENLLTNFPEIEVNVQNYDGRTLLFRCDCDMVTILFGHGLDPEFGYDRCNMHHCQKPNCKVIRHFQKLWLLDEGYVRSTIPWILTKEVKEFISLENPELHEYKEEILRMKAHRLSRRTSYTHGRDLYDFIFMSANEAARYTNNEEILQIYADSEKDFRKTFPHYGFVLNYQFRRGSVRRERLRAAWEFLNAAVGEGLPEIFDEFIFGNLRNDSLTRFSLD